MSNGLAVAQGIVLLGYRITSVTDHPFCTGALWTAARWHHARRLSLSFRGATKKEVAYAFMAVQPCANELMQLHLEWFLNWHDRDDRDNLTGLLLLTWLAAQAEGLRSLSLYFSSFPVLPSLPNLRHLILHLEFADFVASMRVLPLFKSLQTLWLGTDLETQQPDLDLTSCRHLCHVSLSGVVPCKVLLPPGAALHITMHYCWSATDAVWISALPQLRTFRWERGPCLHALPEILTVSSALAYVILDMITIGCEDEPLPLSKFSMPLTSVCISCRDAWVHLQGGTWKHLCITTVNTLHLSSTLCSLLHCPDFYIEHSNEYFTLEEAASALAPSIGFQALRDGRECLWKGLRQFQDLGMSSRKFACTCGACVKCLVKSGKWLDHGDNRI